MSFHGWLDPRRWALLLAVAILLAFCFILLGGQTATYGLGPLPDPGNPADRAEASQAHPLADAQIVLEKNDDYYGAGSVVITRATSLFIDQDEAWTRYQAGQLDTINPPGSALDAIKASPTYSPQLHVYPQAYTYIYGFSHDVPPLDDPLVRGALASAIDRTRLISDVLSGDEPPALTYTPPRHVGYVDGYATGIGRPYSPTVAVDLLAQSGYAGDPPITLMVNTDGYQQAIAETVRDMWYDTLGISATLEHMPWGEYLDLLRNGSAAERPGVWRMGWGSDYPDAHSWHSGAMSFVGPIARYDNPAYDALVQAAAGETDPTTRLALYEQVEATLVQTDTALVPMFTSMQYRLTRPELLRTYRSFGGQHLDECSFSGDPRPIEVAWGAPASLDPALSTDYDYLDQLFLGLTDFDKDTGDVLPELATTWAASSDATVYTFTLRSDATWTDASPVTAHDVEYGVLRSLDPATGSGYAWVLWDIENAQDYNNGSITDPNLVGVEALDNTHIRFTLESPAAYFPVIAGLPPARPQPQWAIDTHGGAWTEPANIVTNGPYKLAHWDQAPYLRISKWADGDPISGGTHVFSIQYRNDGGAAAANCVITDTMLGGMTYISDTSGLPHSGSGSGPIVWDLGTVDAFTSAEFEVHVEVTAAPSSTITNRAQIATDDPNDQGQAWEKESEFEGHVTGPWMMVNYGGEWVQVNYPAGHTVEITVTDPISTFQAYAAKTAVHGQGWWAESGFEAGGGDWSPTVPDIQPDYWVEFRSDDGYHNVIRVGTITGTLDLEDRSISGNIYAPWFNGTLQVWCHTHTQWPAVYVESSAEPDGSVPYYCQWEPDIWDEVRGEEILVTYVEPNDGDWVTNQFRSPDLLMNVNYGHDWVEGDYEPGHTLWLTVTESDSTTEKGTATLETQEIPWWGGRTGFSTNLGDPWDPERPDIQAGDYVYGEMDNGYTSTVRMGLITGTLDLEADTITGKIYADWFTGPLDGWCGVWEEGGPGDGFQFDPNGGSYFCDFGAMDDWDLQAGQQVGIQYREPDGDTVINMFEAPWMRVNAGDDWVGGNYPAGHTFWITVTDSLGTPKGYAETVSDSDSGWGRDGFETRDEDWLGIRPDIEPYDMVYTRSDDGYTHIMQVGDIADDLNIVENTISGTITADWFDETLDVRCEVWGVQDGPDGIDTTAEPDGGSFFCDFDDVGWDLQPGQSVAVQYREPDDGDRIINTFQEPAPDMRVEKWAEGSGEALPGGLAVFTIRYRNEGEATADEVIITDTLDTNMHYEADSSSATSTTFDGDQVIWTLGPVAPNEEIQFQLVVSNTANIDDDLVNRVEIYAAHDYRDWNDDDEAWIHIRGDGTADVYVNKRAEPNRPVPGGTYIYEIDYGNNGPVATGWTVLTDTLPVGTQIVDWYSEDGYGLWNDDKSTLSKLILEAPTLPANWGDRIILRVWVSPALEPGDQLTNTVELDIPVDYASDLHDDVWVSDPYWNSHVNKDFGWGTLAPGGELEYNVHLRNHGNQDTQTWLTDTLPAGTQLSEVWRWDGQQSIEFWPDTLEGQTAVWDLGEMLPGQYYDLDIRLHIDHATEPGTVLTNCAHIGLDGADGWPYDNEDCVVDTVRQPGPNLRLYKEYDWEGEGQLRYDIYVENIGTQRLEDFLITDTYPLNTTFNGDWHMGHGPNFSLITDDPGNRQIVFQADEELDQGNTARIRFYVDLDTPGEQGLCFDNHVEAPIDGDVWPDDNYDQVAACTGPDIYAKKWISGGQPTPGGTVTFTVEFGNQNQRPWDSSGDSRIIDTLPPEMTFVTATDPDDPSREWLPSIDGNELRWDWGWMNHENWWRFYLVVDIADTVETGDVLTNTIEAWSNDLGDLEGNYDNNVYDLPVTVTLNKVYLPIVLKNH